MPWVSELLAWPADTCESYRAPHDHLHARSEQHQLRNVLVRYGTTNPIGMLRAQQVPQPTPRMPYASN
jgi:hypothetical protein